MSKTMDCVWLLSVVLVAPPALAQAEGECGTGFCGPAKPGGTAGGAILLNGEIGLTCSTSDDFDGDGYEDDFDNCPFRPNRAQTDSDGDGVGDGCDNCTSFANADRADNDADGLGDVCDPDDDNDGVPDPADNCVMVPNHSQRDTDGDGLGDACDPDIDNDGIVNNDDPCPFVAGVTMGCDDDVDQDGILDVTDNCPLTANPSQLDEDKDRIGDNCDPDADGDGIPNGNDNCLLVANPDQHDRDNDGMGDACDDDGYCFLAPKNPDPDQCLDPKTEFRVLAAPQVLANTGEEVFLSVYANRPGVPLNYQWSVMAGPTGASETVSHPRGAAVCSDVYECAPVGLGPTFVPCHHGLYALVVSADLQTPDPIEPQVMHAESTVVITVQGADLPDVAGCSSIGSDGGQAGTSDIGGRGGAGGSVAGTAGTGATAGAAGTLGTGGGGGTGPGISSSGCSCATQKSGPSRVGGLLLLPLGFVLTSRLRRRRSRQSAGRRNVG
jgi:hypothetical protein